MSFLESLKKAAKSDNAIFISLLQQYRKKEKSLHLFYEGKDDPSFYTNFVNKYIDKNTKLYFYNCKNKNSVINNFNKVDFRVYKKHRLLFFVDKDHSDFTTFKTPSSSNFFSTKYYSVENYLVSNTMLKRIIRDFMGIADEDFINPILEDFKRQYEFFNREMILISSWIIFHRNLPSNLALENVKLKDIFVFNSSNLEKYYQPKGKKLTVYLDNKNKVTTPTGAWKSIRKVFTKLIALKDPKIFIRGKYEMWFLITYLNNLISDLNRDIPKGHEKYKMNTAMSVSNSITLLGPRLRIPNDIKLFLGKNIAKL